jgi:hypothetical protein
MFVTVLTEIRIDLKRIYRGLPVCACVCVYIYMKSNQFLFSPHYYYSDSRENITGVQSCLHNTCFQFQVDSKNMSQYRE